MIKNNNHDKSTIHKIYPIYYHLSNQYGKRRMKGMNPSLNRVMNLIKINDSDGEESNQLTDKNSFISEEDVSFHPIVSKNSKPQRNNEKNQQHKQKQIIRAFSFAWYDSDFIKSKKEHKYCIYHHQHTSRNQFNNLLLNKEISSYDFAKNCNSCPKRSNNLMQLTKNEKKFSQKVEEKRIIKLRKIKLKISRIERNKEQYVPISFSIPLSYKTISNNKSGSMPKYNFPISKTNILKNRYKLENFVGSSIFLNNQVKLKIYINSPNRTIPNLLKKYSSVSFDK